MVLVLWHQEARLVTLSIVENLGLNSSLRLYCVIMVSWLELKRLSHMHRDPIFEAAVIM